MSRIRGVAQPGRVLGLGPRCRRFEPSHPDHKYIDHRHLCGVFYLIFAHKTLDKFTIWVIFVENEHKPKGLVMLEKFKMMIAARRVKGKKQARKPATRRTTKKRVSIWARIWNAICWVYNKVVNAIRWIWKKICQFARWVWKKLCEINLIGLLNLALLISIFALCTMLIIDITHSRKKPVVIVADPIQMNTSAKSQSQPIVAEPTTKTVRTSSRHVRPRTNTLPILRDKKSNKMMAEPIRTNKEKPNPVLVKQTVKTAETMHGDIVIENRGDAKILHNGTEIQGNLYLQNMGKYVLPCDIKITGNMFIRDVNMLQFCGNFDITGNIYVSPRSSFGPIPTTAHLGGQVIL